MSTYRLLSSEPGPDFNIFKVRIDHQENQRNNYVVKAAVLEAADSANVVAVTKDQQIVMVRQFRFGIKAETLEIPGGMLEKGEDFQSACARELYEETGYVSQNWHYLGAVQANPVFMDSLVHQFVALDATRQTKELQLDQGEQIEMELHPITSIEKMIKDRVIQHPHSLTALMQFIWHGI